MTALLLVTAFSHVLLSLPGDCGFYMLTNLPEQWMNFENRALYNSISNILITIKHAKNFYLFLCTSPDILEATKACIRRISKSKLGCCRSEAAPYPVMT